MMDPTDDGDVRGRKAHANPLYFFGMVKTVSGGPECVKIAFNCIGVVHVADGNVVDHAIDDVEGRVVPMVVF